MKQIAGFWKSFTFAFRGLLFVWKTERSFRIQSFGALGVIILMTIFELKSWEYIMLSLVTALVLVLEIVNTVVEHFVDMVKPRLHSYVGVIKDMMAGAVLLMSIAALVIGSIIFLPHVFMRVIQ